MSPPQPTIPDFEDPEWNKKREELSQALVNAAEAVIHHMNGPGAVELTVCFHTDNGREIQLDMRASPPAISH